MPEATWTASKCCPSPQWLHSCAYLGWLARRGGLPGVLGGARLLHSCLPASHDCECVTECKTTVDTQAPLATSRGPLLRLLLDSTRAELAASPGSYNALTPYWNQSQILGLGAPLATAKGPEPPDSSEFGAPGPKP